MRQQSHSSYVLPSANKRRKRSLRKSSGIKITSMRGFFTALLFLGVPTVSLGALCLALLQNNLQLSQTNDELNEIAKEVKAEVDSLDAEIDSLRERAGVTPDAAADVTTDSNPQANTRTLVHTRALSSTPGSLSRLNSRNSSLGLPLGGSDLGSDLAEKLPPRGGPARAIDALDLLEDAKQQVPQLNRTLDSAIRPALEATLAEEAAFPDGQPVLGKGEVSSEFGIRSNPFGGGAYEVHEGIDFVGAQGDIIAATGNGVVTLAGENGGYGISVTIDHGYGYKTLYAHMSEKRVDVGDRVKRGQIIGHIGSTGRSSGPHLHYSIYKNDKSINPRTLLKLAEPAETREASAN
jgi:murein DD-endopeptidase MepM/ murein hydrolase activator NlpD